MWLSSLCLLCQASGFAQTFELILSNVKKSLKGSWSRCLTTDCCAGLELHSAVASEGKHKNAVSLLKSIHHGVFCLFVCFDIPPLIFSVLSWSFPWFLLYIWKQETDCFCFGFFDIFKKITLHWMHTQPKPGVGPLQLCIWTFSEKWDVPLTSLRWTKPPSVFCVFMGLVSLLERKQNSLVTV